MALYTEVESLTGTVAQTAAAAAAVMFRVRPVGVDIITKWKRSVRDGSI